MKLDLNIADFRLEAGVPPQLGIGNDSSRWNGAGEGDPEKLKKLAKRKVHDHTRHLVDLQERLWAARRNAVLVVLQGMDACGKDSTIRHVTSGVNPAGFRVASFKVPSEEERAHHFLWRYSRAIPERGKIGIFNRSYYEDVLAARVHPQSAGLEDRDPDEAFWEARHEDINAFERHLVRDDVLVVKCFLDVSQEAQRRRLLKRLRKPDKHWKFTEDDLRERLFWDAHVNAAKATLSATSSSWAPWYVVPADHKWFMRAIVSRILVERMRELNLTYPKPGPSKSAAMDQALKALTGES